MTDWAACSVGPGSLSVRKRKWTEDIYLVTEGDLRMTGSRTLERGGMSSTDSGVITSSGWVIFKNESRAAFHHPLNWTAQKCNQAKNLIVTRSRGISLKDECCVAQTFWRQCLFSTMMTAKRVEKTPMRGAVSQIWATWRKSVRPGTADWHS